MNLRNLIRSEIYDVKKKLQTFFWFGNGVKNV